MGSSAEDCSRYNATIPAVRNLDLGQTDLQILLLLAWLAEWMQPNRKKF
jgi:hypothetical protein